LVLAGWYNNWDVEVGPLDLLLLTAGSSVTDVRCYKDYSLPQSFSTFGINIADLFSVNVLGIEPERMEPQTPFLREKFFIEFGAALGYVSFDVGFNPVEFVDFLLGWTTLDITGDDTQEMPKQ
jgi:hypothetical protein